MTMTKIYRGKLPTELDYVKLEQVLGVPYEGQLITYERLEEILGMNRQTSRFRSVVGAWRRKLAKEHNLVFKAVAGRGLECADNHSRVSLCARQHNSGLRHIARSSILAARTSRTGLPPEEVRVLDHIQNCGAQLRLAAATAARQLNYDLPAEVEDLG